MDKTDFSPIPSNAEIFSIVSGDEEYLGYYVEGHFDPDSVAKTTNLDWDLDEDSGAVSASDFVHGYLVREKVPPEHESWEYQLKRISKPEDNPNCFPATYCWR